MEEKYFWEYEYPFFRFLEKIFGAAAARKYSLEGNGIFNLLYLDNKIYEVKFTQARKMLENDNRSFLDKNKELIINNIIENFKNIKEYSVSGGKFITFKVDGFIAKVEVIKKLKEPV